MQPEEIQVVEKARNGDREAFNMLVKTHQRRVYSVIFRWVSNVDDTLDITQETFIRLYKFLPKWNFKSSLFTWLYRVATNLSIDYLRKKKKGLTVSLEEKGLSEKLKANDLSLDLSRLEEKQILRKAIDKLPKKQKEAVLLRYYEGMSIKEVSRVTSSAEGTIKAHLFHAVKNLRRIIKHIEGGSLI